MSQNAFIQHATRGSYLARRTPEVVNPILSLLEAGIEECKEEGDTEEQAVLEGYHQAFLDWIQDTAEIIAALASDYCDLNDQMTILILPHDA